MGHKVNSPFQNKALVSGLNCVVTEYTLKESASGSTTIALCGLPGGAQVVDARIMVGGDPIQDGANPGAVRLYATIGGTEQGNIIATSTITYIISVADAANLTGLGKRMTASANLILDLHDFSVASATATVVFTVMTSYLSDLSSD